MNSIDHLRREHEELSRTFVKTVADLNEQKSRADAAEKSLAELRIDGSRLIRDCNEANVRAEQAERQAAAMREALSEVLEDGLCTNFESWTQKAFAALATDAGRSYVKPALIYLASPYSHSDTAVRDFRFRCACRVAARLMREGVNVFSPIAHTHPIAMSGALPTDWAFWQRYDHAQLDVAAELWVVRMDGWEQSKGIAGEIEYMTKLGRPVKYLDPTLDDLMDDDPTSVVPRVELDDVRSQLRHAAENERTLAKQAADLMTQRDEALRRLGEAELRLETIKRVGRYVECDQSTTTPTSPPQPASSPAPAPLPPSAEVLAAAKRMAGKDGAK